VSGASERGPDGGQGSTGRGGARSWLPLTEVAVVLGELFAFGCRGDKVLLLLAPRGEPCAGLLTASSLVGSCPPGTTTLDDKKKNHQEIYR